MLQSLDSEVDVTATGFPVLSTATVFPVLSAKDGHTNALASKFVVSWRP